MGMLHWHQQEKRKNIELTDSGKKYTQKLLAELFTMEDIAINRTFEKYPEDFIEAMEYFAERLENYLEEKRNE